MAGIAKGSTKNDYSPELIAKVVQLYGEGKHTSKQLAELYGIPERTVHNWTTKQGVKKGDIVEKLMNAYEEEFVRNGIDKAEIATITSEFLHAESNDYSDPKKVKKVPNFKVRKDGLDVYMKLVGVGKESEDKNVNVNPPTVKILIVNSKDGTEVVSNMLDGINI